MSYIQGNLWEHPQFAGFVVAVQRYAVEFRTEALHCRVSFILNLKAVAQRCAGLHIPGRKSKLGWERGL